MDGPAPAGADGGHHPLRFETAHALAGAIELGKRLGPGATILVNLSGRGDKDMETAGKWFGLLDEGAKG